MIHAERMLTSVNAEFDEAKAVVQNLTDGISGELRISTVSYLSTSFVTSILSRYLQVHPNVICHLDIVSDPLPASNDNIDCYVCPTPPSDPNLTTQLLGDLKCRLFASPEYISRHGAPRIPEDLARHKGLVPRRHLSGITLRLSMNGQTTECDLPVSGSTNDYWIMKTMAIDGYGVAVLPEFFARPEVEAGILRPVLADWEAPTLPVYCAYPKQRRIGRKLGAFIELMIESFEQIDVLHFYVAGRHRLRPHGGAMNTTRPLFCDRSLW